MSKAALNNSKPHGENYQIGLVDVCDHPYIETIRAVREVGNTMYKTRSSDPSSGAND